MDEVTIGTYYLASVILNFAFVGTFIAFLSGLPPCAGTTACLVISVKIQFLDHDLLLLL